MPSHNTRVIHLRFVRVLPLMTPRVLKSQTASLGLTLDDERLKKKKKKNRLNFPPRENVFFPP